MEIIGNNAPPKYTPAEKRGPAIWFDRSRSIYIGSTLIVAGLVWLLYNVNILGRGAFDIIFSWQMLMIVIGGYLFSQKRWAAGSIVAAVGIFFLCARIFDFYISFGEVVLPLLLMAAGLTVILNRRRR